MFEWLALLPIWLQVFVVFFSFAIIIFILYKALYGGIKASIKNGTFSISRNSMQNLDIKNLFEIIMDYVEEIFILSNSKKVEKQMKCAEKKLITIKTLKEQSYYKLLKEAGVPHDKLLSCEDSQYYRELVGNMIYSENGSQSTKSILREYIKEGDFINKEGSEFDLFIDEVVDVMSQNWNNYLKFHYDAEVFFIGTDNKQHYIRRLISNESIYDYEKDKTGKIRESIKDLFIQCKKINKDITKQKHDLIAKRKNDLRDVFGIPKKEGE